MLSWVGFFGGDGDFLFKRKYSQPNIKIRMTAVHPGGYITARKFGIGQDTEVPKLPTPRKVCNYLLLNLK